MAFAVGVACNVPHKFIFINLGPIVELDDVFAIEDLRLR